MQSAAGALCGGAVGRLRELARVMSRSRGAKPKAQIWTVRAKELPVANLSQKYVFWDFDF